MADSSKRPSWKHTRVKQAEKGMRLTTKRMITTSVLIILLASVVGWFIWQGLQTERRLYIALWGSSTQPMDKLSIAPLRFTDSILESLEPLEGKVLRSKNNSLQLTSSLDSLKNALLAQREAQQKDFLLCIVQAQCFSYRDQAVIATGDFDLSDDSSKEANLPKGLIAADQLLDTLAAFPGNILLAIDAGDIVADPVAQCPENEFWSRFNSILKKKSNRIWVLASHSPGEVSQDHWKLKQRLFSRALGEAIQGKLRLPEKFDLLNRSKKNISVSDLATYVHLRVRKDSGEKQTPWLLRGVDGAVESNQRAFVNSDVVTIPDLAWSNREAQSKKNKPDENESGEDSSTSKNETSAAKTKDGVDGKEGNVVKDEWVSQWESFNSQWNRLAIEGTSTKTSIGSSASGSTQPSTTASPASDKSLASDNSIWGESWTIADSDPDLYRSERRKLLDQELRARAGLATASAIANAALTDSSTIDAISTWVKQFRSPKASSVFDVTDFTKKQSQFATLHLLSRLNCVYAESKLLSHRLNAIRGGIRSNLPRFDEVIGHFSIENQSNKKLASQLAELQSELNNLVSESIKQRDYAAIESLIQCAIITPDDRSRLIKSKFSVQPTSNELKTYLPEGVPAEWNLVANTLQVTGWNNAPSSSSELDSFEKMVLDIAKDDRLVAAQMSGSGRSDQSTMIISSMPAPLKRQHGWKPKWFLTNSEKREIEWSSQSLFEVDRTASLIRLNIAPYPEPSSIVIGVAPLPDGIKQITVDGEVIDERTTRTIAWSKIKTDVAGNKTFDFRIVGRELDASVNGQIVVKLTAGGSSGAELEQENISLPIKILSRERLALKIHAEGKDRNGDVVGIASTSLQAGKLVRIRPFAGHVTSFRWSLNHSGSKARKLRTELYAIPKHAGLSYQLSLWTPNEFSEFERRMRTDKPFAVSEALEFDPGSVKQLKFAPPSVPSDANAPKESTPTPDKSKTPEANVVAVSNGLCLRVSDVDDPNYQEFIYVDFDPIRHGEYLKATVTVKDLELAEKKIDVELDYDRDVEPLIGPLDLSNLSAELFVDPTWMGKIQQEALVTTIRHPSSTQEKAVPATISFRCKLPGPIGQEILLGVNVDTCPRALTGIINLSDSTPQRLQGRYTDRPRAVLRSVQNGKLRYWAVPPVEPKPGEDFAMIASSPIVFKSAEKLFLDVATDAAEATSLMPEVTIGDQNFPFEMPWGDRLWNFQIVGLSEAGMDIKAESRDRQIVIDNAGLRNNKLDLGFTSNQGVVEPTAFNRYKLIIDSIEPVISDVKITPEIFPEGSSRVILDFAVDDPLSGITDLAFEISNKTLKFEATYPLTIDRSKVKVDERFQKRSEIAEAKSLKQGTYQLIVKATDRAGNATSSKPIRFDVIEKPTPIKDESGAAPMAKAILGTIRGKVKFGGGSSADKGSVELDLVGKKVNISGNGDFSFDEVPLGKYKISATTEFANDTYVGEVNGEFKKESDFKQSIEIELKKSK